MIEELIVFGCFFSLIMGLITWNTYLLMIGVFLLFVISIGIDNK